MKKLIKELLKKLEEKSYSQGIYMGKNNLFFPDDKFESTQREINRIRSEITDACTFWTRVEDEEPTYRKWLLFKLKGGLSNSIFTVVGCLHEEGLYVRKLLSITDYEIVSSDCIIAWAEIPELEERHD